MTELAPPPRLPASIQGPELGDHTFKCIADLAHREAGLSIPVGKSAMVRTRLARRLRALRLPDYEAYCALVQSPAGHEELGLMISALTTNVSHFFREGHHFEILTERALPPLLNKVRAGGRVRIWSAGCSNGQEPYSIAITLREAGFPPDADVRILATDIDPNVIAHARVGQYPDPMTSGIPDALRDKYFTPIGAEQDTLWQADSALIRMIAFRELNLLRNWPMRGTFDAIFCRNVLIYFDTDTQDRLWPRFADALEPGAWLFLGHSERISERGLSFFENAGMTSYRRTSQTSGSPSGGSKD